MAPQETDQLIADLILWIGNEPRPYAEVMDAWRTSCPRLPVWEDAVDRGFVKHAYDRGSGRMVRVTEAGWAFAEMFSGRRRRL